MILSALVTGPTARRNLLCRAYPWRQSGRKYTKNTEKEENNEEGGALESWGCPSSCTATAPKIPVPETCSRARRNICKFYKYLCHCHCFVVTGISLDGGHFWWETIKCVGVDCFDKIKCLLNVDVNVMNVTQAWRVIVQALLLHILFDSSSTSVYESFENGPLWHDNMLVSVR